MLALISRTRPQSCIYKNPYIAEKRHKLFHSSFHSKSFLCKAFVSPQLSRMPNFSCFSCILSKFSKHHKVVEKMSHNMWNTYTCYTLRRMHEQEIEIDEFNFFVAKASVVVITGVLMSYRIITAFVNFATIL